MFTKIRALACILFVTSLTLGTSWGAAAAGASFEGTVTDAKGQPLKGAEIRMKTKEGTVISRTLTDGRGHYLSSSIPAGNYKVELLVNSVLKASVPNQQARANGHSTSVNFGITHQNAAIAGIWKDGKHYVWVPEQTGSHLGGRWVLDDGSANVNTLQLDKADGRMLRTLQQHGSQSGGIGGSL